MSYKHTDLKTGEYIGDKREDQKKTPWVATKNQNHAHQHLRSLSSPWQHMLAGRVKSTYITGYTTVFPLFIFAASPQLHADLSNKYLGITYWSHKATLAMAEYRCIVFIVLNPEGKADYTCSQPYLHFSKPTVVLHTSMWLNSCKAHEQYQSA